MKTKIKNDGAVFLIVIFAIALLTMVTVGILQMTGSSPYTGYQITDVNSDSTVDSQSIDSHISCAGGSQFTFGPLGNLTGGGTQLTVTGQGRTYTITVISGTGIVECSGG